MAIAGPERADLYLGEIGDAEPSVEHMDATVLDLQSRLLEIEERLIPTGLHVLDDLPSGAALADALLTAVAFERPELGLKSLHDILAFARLPESSPAHGQASSGSYARLLELARHDTQASLLIEEINTRARTLVQAWVDAGADQTAAGHLAAQIHEEFRVPLAQARSLFDFLASIVARMRAGNEIEALLQAMEGSYIPPGPGGDIVRNPDIVPTGRNIHALNPSNIPSTLAIRQAAVTVDALLRRLLAEHGGTYPESIAVVLWGTDNIKTEGEATAQVWHLLGVRPLRDSLNTIYDVQLVPLEQLGRPRIDCIVTVSGIYRDLFGQQMRLLDKAVRLCASADEPPELNYIRKHALEDSLPVQADPENTAVRIFSNAAGNYGANVNFAIDTSAWEQEEELAKIFTARKCFAYGTQAGGEEAYAAYLRALARAEVTFQNIDSIEFGITDIDHYNEYTGALTRTIESISGRRPATMLADFVGPDGKIRSVDEMVALETRTKLLNPRWYEGMLGHGYEGVRIIQNQVTNTYGWSVTCKAVAGWIYDGIAGTYILDGDMRARLQSLNPHAAHAIAGRLLEAAGRGYWTPEPELLEQLQVLAHDLEDALEGVHD